MRGVLKRIGMPDAGQFHVTALISQQSPDIALGVDADGAGDQGMMFGYATDETAQMLPIPYVLACDAQRVAQRLSADEQLRTDVLTLSAPGATLRVTAAESDCAAIADADAALRAQLDQLSQIALQLDRGEIEPKQARTLAAVARSELTAAREALSDVAGAVDNPVCIGLTDQLDALAATLGEIARGSDAAAALAGRLRCAHVSATLSLIDFLSALT